MDGLAGTTADWQSDVGEAEHWRNRSDLRRSSARCTLLDRCRFGCIVVLGSLLTWMTATAGIISISRNAFQMGDHESLTPDGPLVMVLGLSLVGIGVAHLTSTSMPRLVQRSPIIVGLGIGLVLGYDYRSIHDWALSLNSSGALGSVGTGFWVCCVGDALALLAGIGLMSSERKVKQIASS